MNYRLTDFFGRSTLADHRNTSDFGQTFFYNNTALRALVVDNHVFILLFKAVSAVSLLIGAEVIIMKINVFTRRFDRHHHSDSADAVNRWSLKPVGSEGYRTAEVTMGGIDTRDLDAKTMMARSVPGLFFVGEAVDVTGWLGGYNFQWAWASGWSAGQAA